MQVLINNQNLKDQFNLQVLQEELDDQRKKGEVMNETLNTMQSNIPRERETMFQSSVPSSAQFGQSQETNQCQQSTSIQSLIVSNKPSNASNDSDINNFNRV